MLGALSKTIAKASINLWSVMTCGFGPNTLGSCSEQNGTFKFEQIQTDSKWRPPHPPPNYVNVWWECLQRWTFSRKRAWVEIRPDSSEDWMRPHTRTVQGLPLPAHLCDQEEKYKFTNSKANAHTCKNCFLPQSSRHLVFAVIFQPAKQWEPLILRINFSKQRLQQARFHSNRGEQRKSFYFIEPWIWLSTQSSPNVEWNSVWFFNSKHQFWV